MLPQLESVAIEEWGSFCTAQIPVVVISERKGDYTLMLNFVGGVNAMQLSIF